MKNLETRRKFLLEKFGFECHCDLCEIEEVKGDNDRYDVYEKLKIEEENLRERLKQPNFNYGEVNEMYKSAIRCCREMYKCAKECSADRFFIISDILLHGLNCAMAAHTFANFVSNNKILAELFKKDAAMQDLPTKTVHTWK